MTIKEIKNKIASLLSDACETCRYDAIEKLSASYNNLCQAQRNQAMPTVELNGSGITYGYAMPTVDRFNNIKDNGI